MLTKEYILSELEKHGQFNEDLSTGTFYDQIIAPLERAESFKGYEWFWDDGCSKGVIVFKELNFVIKIPFYCEYYEGEGGYYDSQDNWVEGYDGEPSGSPFAGVQVEGYCHNNEWDYCETESIRYEVAEKNDMADHFARTWLLGEVRGWPIYAQTKACMFLSAASCEIRSKRNYTQQERDVASKAKKDNCIHLADEWVMDFISFWGVDRFSAFSCFLDEWEITDLHAGNLGYVNGIPCLVDYSSYEC